MVDEYFLPVTMFVAVEYVQIPLWSMNTIDGLLPGRQFTRSDSSMVDEYLA